MLTPTNFFKIVVESHPFETEETGWGEFELVIKIIFHDPSEKQITLYHHLRLYPSDDTVLEGKSVVAEHYDEIVSLQKIQTTLQSK